MTNPRTTTRPQNREERRNKRQGVDSAEGVSAAVEGGALEEGGFNDPELGLDDVVDREDDSIEGPLPPPVGAGGVVEEDDLGLDFGEVEDDRVLTEAGLEIDRAKVMNEEIQRAFTAARDKKVLELRSRGGNVDYKEADKAGIKAGDQVRLRYMLGRPRGFYTKDPFDTIDSDGKRISFPIDSRVPVYVLQRLGKKEVKRLLDQETIQDLRGPLPGR